MRIVIEPSESKFLTHVMILIQVGSFSDLDSRSGLAHFTARALLRGTKKRPFKNLSDSIEVLGGSINIGVDQNETLLRASVLTQNLDAFLDLLVELLSEPAFDPHEMELLKNILQGELEQNLQDPRVLISKALLQFAYAKSGKSLSADGTLEGLGRITTQNLQSFFEENYGTENFIFGITSSVPETLLRSKIKTRFDRLPKGKLTLKPFPVSDLASGNGGTAIIVDRDEMSTVPFFIAVPGVADGDADLITLEMGNFIFGDDFTARLMKVLRSENGWTYGAYSSFSQLLSPKREAGLFSTYLFPSAEFIGKAAPKALELLDTYVKEGLTSEEFDFAKEALMNRYAFRVDSAEKRLSLGIREIATGRVFLQPIQYRTLLSGLKREHVNSIVAKRMSTQSFVIAGAGDEKVLHPVFSGMPGVRSVQKIEIEA